MYDCRKERTMGKAVGIDLGTTNSVVAVKLGDEVVVITNDAGHRTTPSVVAFKPDGEVLVGIHAKRQAAINPRNTIFSIKRIMGKTYEEAQPVQSLVGYEIIRGTANLASVNISSKTYTPQEISAMILSKLKKVAEDYLGEPVTEAVITVPAYFNDAQRKATIEAGEIAGLQVLRIINEPTAAALAYGCDKKKNGIIVVFDLGGGTFDVSILEIGDGVFEVKATSGDNFLGGDDFDKRIVNYIISEIKKKEGVDVTSDSRAMQRIREAAEQAKIELSSQQATEINLPYITIKSGNSEPVSVSLTLTRAQFESMCSDLFDRLREPCRIALEQSGLRPEQIDEVILVGGSTRIPKVQEIVKTIFGREPSKGINPDEAVAIGAAIQAAILKGEVKDILLLDVTPLNLGVAMKDDLFAPVIEANTTIPCKRSEIFTTVADRQTKVQVDIYQGNRQIASANKHLGTFILDGIPPAPRGIPQIEITFDIDANGVLTVSAKDKATGKEKSIKISGASNLSKEEIERMKREAEAYRAQDEQRVEELKKMNECDNLINQIESFMRESGERLSDENRNELQSLINEIKSIKENKDWNRLAQLEQNLYAKLASLYQTLSSEQSQPDHANGTNGYVQGNSSGSEASAAGEPEVEAKATPVDYVDVE